MNENTILLTKVLNDKRCFRSLFKDNNIALKTERVSYWIIEENLAKFCGGIHNLKKRYKCLSV